VISPDAKRVAFLWNAWDEEAVKSRAFGQLHVINADGSGRKKLRAAWDVSVYSWSPDGKWLAGWFAAAEGRTPPKTLALWSAETGEERVLRTLRTELKRRIRFSPDGKWLAYDEAVEGGRPCVIYTLPLDGSATETELVKDATMVGWTPVGQGILFARQRENSSSLFVLPVSQGKAAGSPRQIYNASNIERPLGVTADGKLIYGLENKRADAWIGEIGVRTGELGRMAVQFPADNARVWMTSAALRFSPDGRQVMWSVEPNRIFIRSTAGEKQSSFTVQLTETRRVEWSHDGKALLAAGVGSDGRKGLYRVDPANGAAAFITGNLDIDRGGGAFVPSRDGNTIYYRTPAGKLAAFSPASGSERIIHEDFEGVPNMIVSHDGKRLAIRTGRWLGALVLSSGQYKRLYTRDFSTDHNVMWGLEWSTDDQKLLVIARDCRNAKCELWVFPAEGGEAIRKPLPAEMRGLSVRPEGKVATLRVENHRQVWVLENFLPAGSK
jgi:Tol biopolymer transport system component